jgi:hypothetical protein
MSDPTPTPTPTPTPKTVPAPPHDNLLAASRAKSNDAVAAWLGVDPSVFNEPTS